MDLSASELVRPLRTAENRFLEVLVHEFSMLRKGQGSELRISFDGDSPAIWTRQAKLKVQQSIPEFSRKAKEYQEKLDQYLINDKEYQFHFRDADFPFRYTSGGTLPVIRMNGNEYYALFYRQIFPIGWNIANGGSDNTLELLNPLDIIERELREELIILDKNNRKKYSFAGDLGKPLDHPRFSVVRRFLEIRHHLDLSTFEELPINLKWLEGPDALEIKMKEEFGNTRNYSGCFLNINAEDFGIEIDKIAKINVEEHLSLFDGEVSGNQTVNTPIGLFSVDRFNEMVREGRTEFLPDFFYWDLERHSGNDLRFCIEEHFFPSIDSLWTAEEKNYYQSCQQKFDLCPVTKRIVARYLTLKSKEPPPKQGRFDVFISFGGEDSPHAQKLHDFLTHRNIVSYYSRESIGDSNFHRKIDDALDAARFLIAVGTNPENLKRPWVEYECRAFHQNILNNRNPNASILSFISGFKPIYLPLPLRAYNAIDFKPENIEEDSAKVLKIVTSMRGI
jgi:hypothetical protein